VAPSRAVNSIVGSEVARALTTVPLLAAQNIPVTA
jgi:hypothetical protein